MHNDFKSQNYSLSGEWSQLRPLRPLFRECSNPCLRSAEPSEAPLDESSLRLESDGFSADLFGDEDAVPQMLENLSEVKVVLAGEV